MKPKKTAPSRRRVSFAVDRNEIEINSDWVDAVMNPATLSPSREAAAARLVGFPAPPLTNPTEQAPFFCPDENIATDAETATGEQCTPVEESSAVDKVAPVAQISAVVDESSVAISATVAKSTTVEYKTTVEKQDFERREPDEPVEHNATVANETTDKLFATDAPFASTKDHRIPRPRPILRITDGLTPGQFAVYRLMYEAGEGTSADSDTSARIYQGGYADLGRLTGLSKRGIQNIVAELQAKQVIRLHRQPGYHRTETSAYLVPGPEFIIRVWFANGWRHALGKSKTLIP